MGKWTALALFVGLCLLVEVTAGIFTQSSVREWYPTLVKPYWTPPSWLFGPVWTVLYVLMGVAMWLVWLRQRETGHRSLPYVLWGVQLFLNFLWSFLFFELRSPFYALVDIILLWIAFVVTVWVFHTIRPLAAFLMIPCLVWLAFAASLNFVIWLMN